MSRTERGFTLVEVVVSTALASIIFVALTQALMIGLRTFDATNDRVNEANDQQLIASYFTTDIESAEAVSAGAAALHPSPDVRPTVQNALLMTFTALETDVAAGPSSKMVQGWSIASAGASATGRVRSLMATEQLKQTGSSGQRVARTDTKVGSVTQSIALTPNGAIALRNLSSAAASAPSLLLTRPIDTVQNDVMIAHLVVSGSTIVTPPSGWTLVGSKALGTVLTSLVYVKAAGLTEPDNWTWSFSGTREAAGGIASYSRVSTSTPINQSASSTSGCGSGQAVVRAVWDEWSMVGGVPSVMPRRIAYQTSTVDGTPALSRVECDNEGRVVSTQVLARQLVVTDPVTVSCEPFAKCDGLPVKVTLNVSERALSRETTGRTISFRAVTRSVS